MPYYWKQSNVCTPNAPPSPQDLMTQSSCEQHEVTSLLCFPISSLPVFQNLAPIPHPEYSSLSTHLALLMQLKIVFFTFILGEWHNLYTSLQKNSHAQCFLQIRHLIYIWTAFSVSIVFWEKDTSILNIRALIHFYNLLLQMLQTMGNLW